MAQIKELLEYIFNIFKIWVIIQPWQQGIRVRFGKNKKLLNPGIHFKIPYFDSVYVQETRMRMVSIPIQTVTCSDKNTVTLSGTLGYSINNIETLYLTLYHPESTIISICMAMVTDYISKVELASITLDQVESYVLTELQKVDYGLRFERFEITNFASVKTFRIIKDDSWSYEGINMDTKKQ